MVEEARGDMQDWVWSRGWRSQRQATVWMSGWSSARPWIVVRMPAMQWVSVETRRGGVG